MGSRLPTAHEATTQNASIDALASGYEHWLTLNPPEHGTGCSIPSFWSLLTIRCSFREQTFLLASPSGNFIAFHFESSYLNGIRVFLHRNWFQCHLVRSGNPKESTAAKKYESYLDIRQVV